jgi:hypothetical protein
MTVTVPHYPRPAIFSEESSVLPRSAFPGRLGTLRSPRRARKWRWDLLHGPDSLLGCSTNQDRGRSQFSWGKKTPSAQSASACREEARVPEGEPCPYCAHLAPNPEELRLHLLHLHPEVEPEPDWWDRDAVPPPPLLL